MKQNIINVFCDTGILTAQRARFQQILLPLTFPWPLWNSLTSRFSRWVVTLSDTGDYSHHKRRLAEFGDYSRLCGWGLTD